MCRIATLALSVLVLGAPRASGQETPPDTKSDTFPVSELESELNWRKVARIYTVYGGFELTRPQVTWEGLAYKQVKGLAADPAVPPSLPALIPLSSIERIEVREGRPLLGLFAGTVAGGVVALALYDSGRTSDASGSLSLLFVPLGAIAGLIAGESITRWIPVYALCAAPPN